MRVPASVGRPGGSAQAQWWRARAAEWAAWTRTLPWRASVALGIGASGGLVGSLVAPRLGLALGTLAAVAAGWVLRFRPSPAAGRAPSQPATAALVRSATTSSSRPRSRSTRPVTYRVGATRVALRKLVSSSPSAATPSRRPGSSTSGRPCSATARMMVAQPTPRSRATAATAWASLPTRRQASARARWVNTARGAIPATPSVQVRTLQAGSRQRQMRLGHKSTTGRPPIGRSRTRTTRRPCGVARTPQPTQPTTVVVIWTASCHSPATSSAATTSKPSRSSSSDPDALPC
jgi:hypothetical protein